MDQKRNEKGTKLQMKMASNCSTNTGKSSWPELVGTNGEAAVDIIKSENPNVNSAVTVKVGSMVTMDFRCDRVRVWVDDAGFVKLEPKIG
ncbi:hypothetical protein FNV43_RR01508 [Rhamnella rubrinervis]|uniref:Uncharacterized protein n=1 Tax=Rhamnella rubrinervis TaxID=2594499 RepID=A0A8K0HSM7_9ROSA|nr:hypothetical protein FNV43_RR01508 [Rhamnella rubrinervis]